MITVIGIDKSIFKQVTCRKCASILEYVPNDIETRTVTDYTGGRDITKFIQCPCGNEVTVASY